MERLKENYNEAKFEEMSRDEYQIHLFIREADAQIPRIATEILEKENPAIHQLTTKIKETEAAVWYNQRKEFGKMADMKREVSKFCKPCNSKTHNESDCWVGLICNQL